MGSNNDFDASLFFLIKVENLSLKWYMMIFTRPSPTTSKRCFPTKCLLPSCVLKWIIQDQFEPETPVFNKDEHWTMNTECLAVRVQLRSSRGCKWTDGGPCMWTSHMCSRCCQLFLFWPCKGGTASCSSVPWWERGLQQHPAGLTLLLQRLMS